VGKGRGGRRKHRRGRTVDAEARQEVLALLDGAEPRRDLLIEHLHRIQDATGCLAKPHLVALAEWMSLSLAEVHEVASFYAHFEVVEQAPAERVPTARVCGGLSCALAGGEALRAGLEQTLDGRARVVVAPCMGRCEQAPAVLVGGHALAPATVAAVDQAVRAGRIEAEMPDAPNLVTYTLQGGYRLLQSCHDGRRAPDEIISVLDKAGLRGLGGAGFPTATKWRLVRNQPAPKVLVVNADEGEPGTFKDRAYLEHDPHRFLEGMLIAAWAVDAAEIYIYLRDEYPHLRLLLAKEIDAAVHSGLTGGRPVHLRRGAGAYVCGEESAMLESIEGKRGMPRHRPPYVAERGLFGRPTLVNNVETLYWVRDILERGPEWWRSFGRRGRTGLRSFSVSGRVREPGVKVAPAGITARELIEDHCGGMAEGHCFRAYLPGGAAGGILPESLADLPLDFGTLEEHGALIGSAAVIVLSDQDDLRATALNLVRFFAEESCGRCTPCRLGTEKAAQMLARVEWDRPLLEELAQVMRDASICGLGQAAPNAWTTLLRHFGGEI
jgi:formate dehydrogenase